MNNSGVAEKHPVVLTESLWPRYFISDSCYQWLAFDLIDSGWGNVRLAVSDYDYFG